MKNRARLSVKIIPLVMSVAFLVSGCSAQAGVEQTGLAVALAVDPAGRGLYRWTFMFPNPTITPSSESSIKPSNEFYLLQATAPALSAAVDKISAMTDRHVYLGDVQVTVLNPRLGAPAIVHLLQGFINAAPYPPRSWVVLGSPTANGLLRTAPPEDTVPTVFLGSFFACRICHPVQFQIRLWQAWDALWLPSHTVVLPWGTVTGNQLLIDRSGWMTRHRIIPCTPEETKAWAMVMGRLHDASMAVRTGSRQWVAASMQVQTRRRVLQFDGRPRIKWHITVRGQWQDAPQSGNGHAGPQGNQLLADTILMEIMHALAKADCHHVDPFERRTELSWYTRANRAAANPPVEVTVHCFIAPVSRGV